MRRDRIVITRALIIVDAINAFGSKAYGGELCVPGGEEIGPVIGRIQQYGKDSGIYQYQIAANDKHRPDMFNFAHVNPHKIPFVDRVQDSDGEWATVYPEHAIKGTWGAEFFPGVKAELIDRVFPKGTRRNKDSYSALGNSQLVPWLRKRRVTHIDVVGNVFRICAGLSAIELAQKGFEVRLLRDATRDLEIDAFRWVLNELKYENVQVIDSHKALPRMPFEPAIPFRK